MIGASKVNAFANLLELAAYKTEFGATNSNTDGENADSDARIDERGTFSRLLDALLSSRQATVDSMRQVCAVHARSADNPHEIHRPQERLIVEVVRGGH